MDCLDCLPDFGCWNYNFNIKNVNNSRLISSGIMKMKMKTTTILEAFTPTDRKKQLDIKKTNWD